MMSDIFLSPERPFYHAAQVVAIQELDEHIYYNFASAFFEERGQQLPETVFSYIYQKMEGQTWYVQAVMNKLYANQEGNITERDANKAIEELINEQEVAFQNYYYNLTSNQASLLLSIAKEQKVKSPMSQEFITKHRLPAVSSIKAALKSLSDSQLIYKYQGAYVVYDRFFGLWLREKV